MARLQAKTEVAGSVWKIIAAVGQKLAPGDVVMLVESMKMEIPVSSAEPGTVKEILVEEGATVGEGAVIVRLDV